MPDEWDVVSVGPAQPQPQPQSLAAPSAAPVEVDEWDVVPTAPVIAALATPPVGSAEEAASLGIGETLTPRQSWIEPVSAGQGGDIARGRGEDATGWLAQEPVSPEQAAKVIEESGLRFSPAQGQPGQLPIVPQARPFLVSPPTEQTVQNLVEEQKQRRQEKIERKAELERQEQVKVDRGLAEEVGASLGRGILETFVKTPVQAAQSLAWDFLGSEAARKKITPVLNYLDDIIGSEEFKPSYQASQMEPVDLTSIVSDPKKVVGQIAAKVTDPRFWAAEFPQGAASMAPVILGGWAPRAVARAAGLGKAMEAAVMAGDIATAAQAAAKIQKLGQIGMYSVGMALEAGQAADSIRQYEVENPDKIIPWDKKVLSTVGTGVLAGSLEAMSLSRIFSGKGGQALVQKVLDSIATEGSTEGAQSIIENAFVKYGFKPDQKLLEGVVESVLVGAGLGALGGAGQVGRASLEKVREFNKKAKAEQEIPWNPDNPVVQEWFAGKLDLIRKQYEADRATPEQRRPEPTPEESAAAVQRLKDEYRQGLEVPILGEVLPPAELEKIRNNQPLDLAYEDKLVRALVGQRTSPQGLAWEQHGFPTEGVAAPTPRTMASGAEQDIPEPATPGLDDRAAAAAKAEAADIAEQQQFIEDFKETYDWYETIKAERGVEAADLALRQYRTELEKDNAGLPVTTAKAVAAAELDIQLVRDRGLREGVEEEGVIGTEDRPVGLDLGPGKASPATGQAASFAPEWYSRAAKVLGDPVKPKLPGKGTPQRFIEVIQGFVKNGTVKADEIKASGVIPWLEEKKGKVSRGEVLEFLEGEGLERTQVGVVMKAWKGEPLIWEEHQPGIWWAESWQPGSAFRIERTSEGRFTLEHPWAANEGEFRTLWDARQEALATNEISAKSEGYLGTKFQHYLQLPPSWTNGREMFLTLPPNIPSFEQDVKAWEDYKKLLADKYGPDFGNYATTEEFYRLNELARLASSSKDKAEAYPTFRIPLGHFTGDPAADINRFAHVFLADYPDPATGKKYLVVTELQSDWAAKGRREGYAVRPTRAEAEAAAKKIEELENRIIRGEELTPAESEEHNRLADITAAYHDRMAPAGVPPLPFAKNWMEVALKKTLRLAAEEGYDGVMWPNGEMVKERYDLSKVVSELRTEKTEDGYKVLAFGHNGNEVLDNVYDKKGLADAVGKDLAEKVVSAHEVDSDETTWEGEDLKVGGEWANRQYDGMMPQFLSKYGKQWGAKVGTAKISTKVDRPDLPWTPTYPEWYTSEDVIAADLREAELVEKNKESVHALDFTSSMKRSLLYEGQAKFKPAEQVGGKEIGKDDRRTRIERDAEAAQAEVPGWTRAEAAQKGEVGPVHPTVGPLARNVWRGSLSADEVAAERRLGDIATGSLEINPDYRSFWPQVRYSPGLGRSAEFKRVAAWLKSLGIDEVFPVQSTVVDGYFMPTGRGNFMMLNEFSEHSLDLIAGHEAFHHLKRQGYTYTFRLMDLVDYQSKAFQNYRTMRHRLDKKGGMIPVQLSDLEMAEELCADFAAGMDRVKWTWGRTIDLTGAFSDLAAANRMVRQYQAGLVDVVIGGLGQLQRASIGEKIPPVKQGIMSKFDTIPGPSRAKPRFPNAEVESRWNAAKRGIDKKSKQGTIQKATEVTRTVLNQFREYADLPEKAVYAPARNSLRLLKAAGLWTTNRTVENLKRITADLDTQQFELFNWAVFVNDLYYMATVKGFQELPQGFTPETIQEAKTNLDQDLSREPAVQKALERRRETWDKAKVGLIEQAKELGLNIEDRFDNPDYYRHIVLEVYEDKVKGRQPRGPGSSMGTAVAGRSYLKGRKEHTKDISANYFQTEFEAMSQILMDTEILRTVNDLAKRYSVANQLKAEAANQTAATGQEVDWHDLIPEGYVDWTPKGRMFHKAFTPTEVLMQMAAEKELSSQDVAAAISAGRFRQSIVIPEELAATLDKYSFRPDKQFLTKVGHGITSLWKQWTLMSPMRFLKYNTNNLLGDANRALAAAPLIATYVGEATRELLEWKRGGYASPDIDNGLRRGVVDSTLTVEELGDVGDALALAQLIDKSEVKEKVGLVKRWFNFAGGTTVFRENILRLAALKYVQNEWANGNKMLGYSKASEVAAIPDEADQVAHVSRHLLGDYASISEFMRHMRKFWLPFGSFQEINLTGWPRGFINAMNEGRAGQFVGLRAAGALITVPLRLARFVPLAGALWFFTQALNMLRFPDEEQRLQPYDQGRVHLILGKREDGTVMIARGADAFGEFLQTFGLTTAPLMVQRWLAGQVTYGEMVRSMVDAAGTKVYNTLTPLKTLGEIAAGRSGFSSVMEWQKIPDRGRALAQMASLGPEYDWATKRPGASWRSKRNPLWSEVNLNETDYYAIRELVRDFKKKELAKGGGVTVDERSEVSQAYYDYAKAKFYKDQAAEDAAKDRLAEAGATRRGLKKSMKSRHPLYGLDKKERRAFLNWLTPAQQDRIFGAEDWYHRLLEVD